MISEQELATAVILRENYGPMRRADGTLDVQAVAMEQTARAALGLPGYIMALDGPGLGEVPPDGLDPMEDQNSMEDQTRDPEDTMPAQGWATLTQVFAPFLPPRHQSDYVLLPGPDAGRFPALRKDTTMAPVEIGHAEVRMDYGHAAERGEMIDHLTGLDSAKLVEELEGRPVKDLRELHHQAAGTEAWHQQGVRDARNLSQVIGRLLRSVGDEIDPQTDQAGPSMGTLR